MSDQQGELFFSEDSVPKKQPDPGIEREPFREPYKEPYPDPSEVYGNKPVRNGKNKRGLNIVFTIVILILLGFVGYLLITLSGQRKDTEEMRITLEQQKLRLTNELGELYASYDSLHTQNDSMNVLLEREKQRINDLLAIKASNAKKIQVYEGEVVSLRGILRSYITQVDSLNQANLRLRAENLEQRDRIQQATNVNRQLENQVKSQQDKIETAAVLKAVGVFAEPIDDNGTIQKKIKKVTKIRTCFTLTDNPLAKPGPRQVYIRIARPDERVMINDINNTFDLEGTRLPYSATRQVEYEGVSLEACIFYDAGAGDIIEGTFYVDVYLEGRKIGTTSFSLK